jgi:multiple sugar transport system ATP-binding protein
MGDRIAVMKDGLLQQVDTPRNIFGNPVNMFVAGFIGSPPMNMLPMTVEQQGGEVVVTTADSAGDNALALRVPARFRAALQPYTGKQIMFGLRPEDIHDAKYAQSQLGVDEKPEDLVTVRTRVDVVEPMGSEIYLYLLQGKNPFVSRVDARTDVQPTYILDVAFNMDRMHAFDMETQASLIDKNKV